MSVKYFTFIGTLIRLLKAVKKIHMYVFVQCRAKENEQSLVREVPPGLIGYASAAMS